MFRRFAGSIPGGADTIFRLHPSQLALFLEQVWELRRNNPAEELGHPDRRSNIPGLPGLSGGAGLGTFTLNNSAFNRIVDWEHLIYAYAIENTKVYEIFAKVLFELLHGELLGVPLENGSEHWLRNTESLFYSDPAPFLISRVVSEIRPDKRATRRNAYFRLLGLILDHGQGDNKDYPFHKPRASNTEFWRIFEDLLREVWVGIINVTNTNNERPTDESAIADLAERLFNMLRSRRETGNLSREEFYAVSTMSWFHLTLEYDSPIVQALRAEASSPEERLFKIAQRVGVPANGKSRSFFEMADALSRILILIETGNVNDATAAQTFFDPSGGNTVPNDMRTIITHWSIVTGRDMKRRVTPVTETAKV